MGAGQGQGHKEQDSDGDRSRIEAVEARRGQRCWEGNGDIESGTSMEALAAKWVMGTLGARWGWGEQDEDRDWAIRAEGEWGHRKQDWDRDMESRTIMGTLGAGL